MVSSKLHETKPSSLGFPKLMRSETGIVVLFFTESAGTVVSPPTKPPPRVPLQYQGRIMDRYRVG